METTSESNTHLGPVRLEEGDGLSNICVGVVLDFVRGRCASFDHDAFNFDGHNLKVWQVGWARGDSESELALVLIVKSPSFYAQTWVCLSQTPCGWKMQHVFRPHGWK